MQTEPSRCVGANMGTQGRLLAAMLRQYRLGVPSILWDTISSCIDGAPVDNELGLGRANHGVSIGVFGAEIVGCWPVVEFRLRVKPGRGLEARESQRRCVRLLK
jgi:hypothetical protein